MTDVKGNVTNCDPVLTTVVRETKTQTFTNVPSAERFVTVTNGTPGLKMLRASVNDHHFVQKLDAGQTTTLDIGSALQPGDTNTSRCAVSKGFGRHHDLGRPVVQRRPERTLS